MFVGIDVSKDRRDVHIRPRGDVGGTALAVSRGGAGLDELVVRLRATAQKMQL